MLCDTPPPSIGGRTRLIAAHLHTTPRGGVRWKLKVQYGTERKRSAVRRRLVGEPAALGEAQYSSASSLVVATVSYEVLRFLPGETSRPPPAGTRAVAVKNERTTWQRDERSRMVAPHRKAVERRFQPLPSSGGGKATTASQPAEQLGLFHETAANPQGADGGADADLSLPVPLAVPKSRNSIDEKIRELTPRTWGQSLRDCIRRVNEYFLGWMGFFHIVSRSEILATLDAHTRRRLRAIAIRHWRRKRRDRWKPLKPGRRAWWFLSNTSRVTRALSNACFAGRGLVSLESEWQRYHRPPIIAPVQLALVTE